MDPLIASLIGAGAGLVVGALVAWLVSQRSRTALAVKAAAAESSVAGLQARIDAADAQYDELLDRMQQERDERTARDQQESTLLQTIAPVRDQLQQLQAKIADIENQRSKQHGEISQQLLTARQSEEQLRATAESLASALRSNSVRGVWGETQLRRLVEAAGLLEHVDFVEQESVASDAGQGRIDMVVHLSDGKALAIDSKVPFSAYLEASEIPPTATGAEAERRTRLMQEHVKALRGHIDALAKREYWAGLAESPELVIGFIPSEALLSSALEADPALLDYAFRKNVALASPVTLWAVLKTIAYSWRQEAMSKDAKLVFDLASELYTRIRTMAQHAERMRSSLESTVKNYNQFASSLETRVLVTARRIDSSGDPASAIAEAKTIEEAPRALAAPELLALPEDDE